MSAAALVSVSVAGVRPVDVAEMVMIPGEFFDLTMIPIFPAMAFSVTGFPSNTSAGPSTVKTIGADDHTHLPDASRMDPMILDKSVLSATRFVTSASSWTLAGVRPTTG